MNDENPFQKPESEVYDPPPPEPYRWFIRIVVCVLIVCLILFTMHYLTLKPALKSPFQDVGGPPLKMKSDSKSNSQKSTE